MALAQGAQGVERAVPVLARIVGEDGGRVHQLAGGVHHRHLDAGANAGVQAHHHARPGGCGQQQVAHIVGKHLDGHALGVFAQARKQVALNGQTELDAPGPGNTLANQVVCRAALVAPAQAQRNARLGQGHDRALGLGSARTGIRRGQSKSGVGQHQLGVQNVQRAPPKHRQRPVRGHAANRLVVSKVVAKLGHLGLVFVFALNALALQQALVPQPGAQVLHHGRRLRPALAQQITHAVQHQGHGREIGLFVFAIDCRAHGHQIGQRLVCGHQFGVGKQRIGQRLQPGFARQLPLGAALELEGQVNIFQLLLGDGGLDGGHQGRRELALFVNRLGHHQAPVAQLAQIGQTRLQLAQLNVVQPVGHLFAVTGNKRHGGAPVEQGHGGLDLARTNSDFLRDLRDDFLHGKLAGASAGAGLGGVGTG